MFRHSAKMKDSGKDREAVVISPSGEEVKIQAKQRSDSYFAFTAKMKDSGKTEQRLLFRHSAKMEDSGKAKTRLMFRHPAKR
jgi:hypothetical protein